MVMSDPASGNHADSDPAGLGQAQGSVFLTSYQMIPRSSSPGYILNSKDSEDREGLEM